MEDELFGLLSKYNKIARVITRKPIHESCIWDRVPINMSNFRFSIPYNSSWLLSPGKDQLEDLDDSDEDMSRPTSHWNTAFLVLQLYALPVLSAVALVNNMAIVLVCTLSRSFQGAIFPCVRRIVLFIAIGDIGAVLFYHVVIWLGVRPGSTHN